MPYLQVITKLLYLLNQGETFTKVRIAPQRLSPCASSTSNPSQAQRAAT
jgi:hypothetical protein